VLHGQKCHRRKLGKFFTQKRFLTLLCFNLVAEKRFCCVRVLSKFRLPYSRESQSRTTLYDIVLKQSTKMKLSKRILKGTILSILIFFSISFITILFQLNSPINRQIDSTLNIGFPFIYYTQFFVEPPILNSGWNIKNLILDCLLVWIIVNGITLLNFTKNGKQLKERN